MGDDDIPLNDQTIRWAIGKLRDHMEMTTVVSLACATRRHTRSGAGA